LGAAVTDDSQKPVMSLALVVLKEQISVLGLGLGLEGQVLLNITAKN